MKPKKTAKINRTLDMRDIKAEIAQLNEDRKRMKDLAMQLADDVAWIHNQFETIRAQVTGLIRRPRL